MPPAHASISTLFVNMRKMMYCAVYISKIVVENANAATATYNDPYSQLELNVRRGQQF